MAKTEDPGMWINPKSNMHNSSHRAAYGEGQNSHNSRYLELADVALSPKNPEQKKAIAATTGTTPAKR
ncbi:MAG TPA: hypothetical protein VGN44_16495 [Candidatus Angelobacter sp.]|jgi:hypothetical protein